MLLFAWNSTLERKEELQCVVIAQGEEEKEDKDKEEKEEEEEEKKR